MVGLVAWGINKHQLRGVIGVNTGHFVARGLRFFTGDTDFLTDQMVHQCGFAHIRSSNNGHKATAVIGRIGIQIHLWPFKGMFFCT